MVVLVTVLGGVLHGCDLHFSLFSVGGVGPGTGTRSIRLPVEVTPAAGLRAGSVVRVRSDRFAANAVVGVAVCLRAADVQNLGVAACDTTSGARYTTDAKGRLNATFAVPRVVTVAGMAHDCAATSARCMVVAADASNFNQSGGKPIGFRAGLPPVALVPDGPRPRTDLLPITAVPAGPVAPNTAVRVTVRGFQPNEPLLLAHCVNFATEAPEDACEPLDLQAAIDAVMFHEVLPSGPRAGPDGTFTTSVTASPVVTPESGSAHITCAAKPGVCEIVVAAAADTKRSAMLPYTLARH